MTLDQLRQAYRNNERHTQELRFEIGRCRKNAAIWDQAGFGTVTERGERVAGGTSLSGLCDQEAELLEKAMQVSIQINQRIANIGKAMKAREKAA